MSVDAHLQICEPYGFSQPWPRARVLSASPRRTPPPAPQRGIAAGEASAHPDAVLVRARRVDLPRLVRGVAEVRTAVGLVAGDEVVVALVAAVLGVVVPAVEADQARGAADLCRR